MQMNPENIDFGLIGDDSHEQQRPEQEEDPDMEFHTNLNREENFGHRGRVSPRFPSMWIRTVSQDELG